MASQADLNLEQMVTLIKKRTKLTNDDPYIISELNDALSWVWQRIYRTNPDVQLTFGTTGTLSVDSQTLDLTTAVSSTIWGLKRFWIKGTFDTFFVPALFKDADDPEFVASEQLTAQVIHPVFYTVYNFNQIRFGNTLPALTQWKADWYGEPPTLSLDTNAANTTFPPPLHYPTTTRAVALVFNSIDDSRDQLWFALANERISLATQQLKRRQFQNKSKTKPYPARSGGAYWPPQR